MLSLDMGVVGWTGALVLPQGGDGTDLVVFLGEALTSLSFPIAVKNDSAKMQ